MFRCIKFPLFAIVSVLAAAAFCQTKTPDSNKPDAAALLQQVREKYAQTKYYQIEAIEEVESTGELDRQWSKSLINAAVADGNRYRFEGRTSMGWLLKMSDGKTEWTFDHATGVYTQGATTEEGPARNTRLTMSQFALHSAQNLVSTLTKELADVVNAAYLPDETLTLEEQHVPCYVIDGHGKERGAPRGITSHYTFWIDKETQAVRKVREHAEGNIVPIKPNYRIVQDQTTVYPKVSLGAPSLQEAFFEFKPPAGTALAEELPDPMNMNMNGAKLVGKMAPEIKLPSAGGETVTLGGLRGKPVLLDFWATWCVPCVASLPSLAQLVKEASEKGLVTLSIDEDEDAKTATEFWSKHKEPWPNFHDADGEMQRAFGSGGIPKYVIIDASGKIIFVQNGSDETPLRAAVAKLGPEFASLMEEPRQ